MAEGTEMAGECDDRWAGGSRQGRSHEGLKEDWRVFDRSNRDRDLIWTDSCGGAMTHIFI